MNNCKVVSEEEEATPPGKSGVKIPPTIAFQLSNGIKAIIFTDRVEQVQYTPGEHTEIFFIDGTRSRIGENDLPEGYEPSFYFISRRLGIEWKGELR